MRVTLPRNMQPGASYPQTYPQELEQQGAIMSQRDMKKAPKSLIYLGALVVVNPCDSLRWWSRGELNPRPQAITGQIYMLSRLI